ncbi:MAG: pyridoxal phosphate-dependent aminotransferase [Deltaproteobacteria bacterium]|jgi:cystathionine beta-lyase|nr:pyridoxal phosphate-dependent aminotransferase [Deltaproteobacteria bacterium]
MRPNPIVLESELTTYPDKLLARWGDEAAKRKQADAPGLLDPYEGEYDFDAVVDRKDTNSLKFDFARERGVPEGLLPLWVADMDFPAPKPVLDRLEALSRHGIFGYTEAKEDYYAAVAGWFARRHGYEPKRQWLKKAPGVVFALAMAIRALTEPGEAVLIQTPVYYPFTGCCLDNDRVPVSSQLVLKDGRYEIDFDDFEKKLVEGRIRLFLLCNPHNPIGRVWTEEELKTMGELCLKHGCRIFSDEIHCDFVFPGHRHLVFGALAPELADLAIVATAPSKTFNLAGLQIANLFVANPDLKSAISQEIRRTGYSQLNAMGLLACQSSYERGEPWLDRLMAHLKGNLDYARDFIQKRLSPLKLIEPEGTYLLWLDCRALDLTPDELNRLILEKARLWLDDGPIFGAGGEGFQRINAACPRKTLSEALERLAFALA